MTLKMLHGKFPKPRPEHKPEHNSELELFK